MNIAFVRYIVCDFLGEELLHPCCIAFPISGMGNRLDRFMLVQFVSLIPKHGTEMLVDAQPLVIQCHMDHADGRLLKGDAPSRFGLL